MAPDTQNPCDEILLDEDPGPMHAARIEEHSRKELIALGIRSEDGLGLFPGALVVQRVVSSFRGDHRSRCGTVIAAVDTTVAVLWGPWVLAPTAHADVVASVSHAAQAVQALGRQCESTGKALSFFVKTQQAHGRKTRR